MNKIHFLKFFDKKKIDQFENKKKSIFSNYMILKQPKTNNCSPARLRIILDLIFSMQVSLGKETSLGKRVWFRVTLTALKHSNSNILFTSFFQIWHEPQGCQ